MKEVTIKELVNALQGKTVKVESADIYGINLSFSKARIEYDDYTEVETIPKITSKSKIISFITRNFRHSFS